MATMTFYPDLGHASTTSDEGIDRDSVDESLATIRAGAGVAYGYSNFGFSRDGGNAAVAINSSATTNQFATLGRFIATFDTSALGSGATITGAVISLYGFSKRSNLGSPDLHSCGATPSNVANIAIADFSNLGTVSFGSLANASWSNAGYNGITLNASGIANINKTGISSFGWKLDWDINNSFTGSWTSGDASSFEFRAADINDLAFTPKLVVTYTTNTTTTKTTTGTSRIQIVTPRTVTGKADIAKTTTRTVNGSYKIADTITTRTVTGISRIFATTTRTTSGTATVQKSTTQSIAGTAKIVRPSSADLPPKNYRYEVDRDGAKIGDLPADSIKSDFGYSQEINSAGAQLKIVLKQTPDTPGQETIGNTNNGIMIRNGNRIKVYEIGKYYPNGRIVFQGQINRYEADYLTDEITVLVLSDGLTLDNYVIQGEGEVADVSHLTGSTSTYLQNESQPNYHAVGQRWIVSGGVTNLEAITVRINTQGKPLTIKIKVFPTSDDAWYNLQFDANLLGSSQQTITNSVATDYKFIFSPSITVTAGQNYFFAVYLVNEGSDQALIYYDNTDSYVNGEMYVNVSRNSNFVPTPISDVSAAADLYFKTWYSGNSVEFTYTSTDPSTMLLSLMARYALAGGLITVSGDSVSLTGVSATYRFKLNTAWDAIKKCLQLAPSGWYFYVDVASDVLYFKQTSITADFMLTKGKEIGEFKLIATIENITNSLYFSGGPTAGVNLFKFYSNYVSIGLYGARLKRISDNRVTAGATADLIGNSTVADDAAEKYQTEVVILDDIVNASLYTLGKTVGFQGFQTETDSLILQIVRIDYSPDQVKIMLGSLPVRVNSSLEQLRRDVEAEQTLDNPASPT